MVNRKLLLWLSKTQKRFIEAIKRVGLSTGGSIAIAASNFLLTLVLIGKLESNDFGFFAFCMAIINFSYSVSNAMVCTPLSIYVSQSNPHEKNFYYLRQVNLMLAIITAVAIFLLGLLYHIELSSSALMAMAAVFGGIRWFDRAVMFSTLQKGLAGIADLLQASILTIATVLLFLADPVSLSTAATVLLLSLLVSVLVLRRVQKPDRRLDKAPWSSIWLYRYTWKKHARWTMLGVVTTELTANGHIYVVTFLAGPVAFAPIAVVATIWRPLLTIFSALTLAERPAMAKALGNRDYAAAKRILQLFTNVTWIVFILNAICAVSAWLWAKYAALPLPYSYEHLLQAGGLWSVVMILRAMRTPPSVYIQAAARFKELAQTSFWAAPLSLILSALLTFLIGPIASIAGIIAGEIAMAFLVLRLAKEIRDGI